MSTTPPSCHEMMVAALSLAEALRPLPCDVVSAAGCGYRPRVMAKVAEPPTCSAGSGHHEQGNRACDGGRATCATPSSPSATAATVAEKMAFLHRRHMASVPVRRTQTSFLAVNGYTLVGVLRDDALATTFKATTDQWDPCVVKVMSVRSRHLSLCDPGISLSGSSQSSEDWTDCLQKLDQLDHPALARVYQWQLLRGDDTDDDTLFIAREYLTEATRMAPRRVGDTFECDTLPQSDIFAVINVLLTALVYLHAKGVHHGRLKPSNIMSDGHGHVVLADYGLLPKYTVLDAKPRDPAVFDDVDLLFQSPQVLNGEPFDGPANDMWSVGVLVYMAMTGRPPFSHPWDAAATAEVPPVPVSPGIQHEHAGLLEFFVKHLLQVKEGLRWTARDALEFMEKQVSPDELSIVRSPCLSSSPLKREAFKSMTTSDSCAVPAVLQLDGNSPSGVPARSHTVASYDISLLVDADAPDAVFRSISNAVPPFISIPAQHLPSLRLDGGSMHGSGSDMSSALSTEVPQPPAGSRQGHSRAYLIEAVAPPSAMAMVGVANASGTFALSPHPPRSSSVAAMTANDAAHLLPCTLTDNQPKTPLLPSLGGGEQVPVNTSGRRDVAAQKAQSISSTAPRVVLAPQSLQHRRTSTCDPEGTQSLLAFAEAIGPQACEATKQRSALAPKTPSRVSSNRSSSPAFNVPITVLSRGAKTPMSMLPSCTLGVAASSGAASTPLSISTTDRSALPSESLLSPIIGWDQKGRYVQPPPSSICKR